MPPKTTKQSKTQARRTETRRAFLFDHHSDQASQLYRHFGKQIRDRREKRGLTQTELAKQASISRGYLSQIEAGQRQVSLHVALKLATLLQFSIDELLETD
jgi:ribosome-binding protein aMBF1 (putative translation factor)